MRQKLRIMYLFAMLGLMVANAQAETTEKSAGKFTRQSLYTKRAALPSSTMDTHVIRVQFPKGYKTPVHTHEGSGPRYVLKGKLKVEDSGETKVYGAGEVFWETGAAMTVENVGTSTAEILIFELAPVKSDGSMK
jgi:quercetin dioxygenase-like cupin family protein